MEYLEGQILPSRKKKQDKKIMEVLHSYAPPPTKYSIRPY